MQGSGCIEIEKENNQIRKKKLEDVQNVKTTLSVSRSSVYYV